MYFFCACNLCRLKNNEKRTNGFYTKLLIKLGLFTEFTILSLIVLYLNLYLLLPTTSI